MRLAHPGTFYLVFLALLLGCASPRNEVELRPNDVKGHIPSTDNRRWQTFTRMEGGLRKVIVSCEIEPETRANYPIVVTVRLPYQEQPNRLPPPGELDRVSRIEDQIIAQLEQRKALYVGHVTGLGAMKVVLYMPDRPPPVLQVKTGTFRKAELQLEIRDDPHWSIYELELAPTELEAEESANRHLLSVLREQGDDHSQTRPVDFAAYFPNEPARKAFLDELAGQGFRPGDPPIWQSDDGEYWCELVKDTNIEPETIARVIALVRSAAKKHGGEYDGWATVVMK